MKVLFFSPYIPDHFGGGEKHLFDVASTVATKHSVYIALPTELFSHENNQQHILKEVKEKYEAFLNYSLDSITFIPSCLKHGSLFQKLQETRTFDYVYYATDGSFFLSLAKKNNLHIQIPFTNKLGLWEKIKLANWNIKNTNSEFTKRVVEKNWSAKINYVHHPLVSLEEIRPQLQKEKIILHVGRFFKQLHSKRQDVLVQFFKHMVDSHAKELKGWKLILVGTVEDESYLAEVQKSAQGYPIEIKTGVSRPELIKLYQQAAVYWHATGFEVDENKYPEKVEHFGISTIEAMAAGCVPIVINKGGQKEILGSDLQGLLWNSEIECLDSTMSVIRDTEEFKRYQKRSLDRVKTFGRAEFERVLWKMF